jgi:coenzyme F420-reducing hydrogenase beta subunit
MDDIMKVIDGDYCVGCGVCAFADPSFAMKMDMKGRYQAVPGSSHNAGTSAVCPFANSASNEDVLGESLFGSVEGIHHDSAVGFYLQNYIGHVELESYREQGGSGGMVSWFAAKLLEEGMVDAVIHVKDAGRAEVMYSYQVSNSVEELKGGAKSKYYPIELSKVLEHVKYNDQRFAIIGIPCFIKALRLLEKQDEVIASRILFHIGLVCGHLKSTFFAEAEAWESGISPENLEKVDFRHKFEDRAASDYGIEATGAINGELQSVIKPVRELSVSNWGLGYFKYNACEYCDDVMAETADITCGDAWLPGYSEDGKGTNILVVRNPVFEMLLNKYSAELQIESVPVGLIVKSQSSGLRHRREGLKYRLSLKDRKGGWRPTKRVEASESISRRRKKIYQGRLDLLEASFSAFQEAKRQQNFSVFSERMKPILTRYKRADNPLYRRIARRIKKSILRVIK